VGRRQAIAALEREAAEFEAEGAFEAEDWGAVTMARIATGTRIVMGPVGFA
jgi:hypothetical protein